MYYTAHREAAWSVVKLWGNAGERRSPSVFGGGTLTRPLWVDAGERGVPLRPLHHQLKSKHGQFFARQPQVLFCFVLPPRDHASNVWHNAA